MNRKKKISLTLIRSAAERISERFKVEKIVLFGSYAYGHPAAHSDVDLLVVMETRKRFSEIRYQMYTLLEDCRIPLDVVIRRPGQVSTAMERRDWFLLEVLQKGRVLYG
ncbi:MAG TPA: hypothetical protein DCP63_04845 [Bacteroidetes bacterium]|nr:hypothetical protein [Bacteroidota bacterium]